MAKMKEGSRAYIKEVMRILCSKVIIYTCQHCGHPVEDGFCCGNCGSESPVDHKKQQDPFNIDVLL